MKQTKNKNRKNIFFLLCCCCCAFGFIVLITGTATINPINTQWVQFGGGDNFQHYIGWRFFRNTPWTRYLLFMRNLNYPIGTSVIVTDSNPLFCLFFKLLSPILPQEFQFNGIWLAACYTLIALFATMIGLRLTKSRWYAFIFMAFSISNPVILQRALIHDTLCAHWIILAAFYLVLTRSSCWNTLGWFLLAGIILLIHVYFLPITFAFLLAQLILELQTKERRKSWFLPLISFTGGAALTFLVAGYQNVAPQTGQYGELSMNLNAFFNPDGVSRFLPALPTLPLQYEGFNYWGLGLILAFLAFGLPAIFTPQVKRWLFPALPFWGLLLIAVSNAPVWGTQTLFTIPFPQKLTNLLSTFRSSGRLAWAFFPIVTAIVVIQAQKTQHRTQQGKWTIPTALCLLLILQWADLSGFMHDTAKRFRAAQNHQNEIVLTIPFWNRLADEAEHIAVSDGNASLQNQFALLAANHHRTFNRSANARGIRPIFGGDWTSVEELIRQRKLEPKTLYILLEKVAIDQAQKNYENVKIIDGIGYILF